MEVNIVNTYQVHKYKNGHQLLKSNVTLDRNDQDTVDRLSDISGQIRPGETFDPYLTCYPLPSKKYFVVARTWQDLLAPRAGCVVTKSIIIPIEKWLEVENYSNIFNQLNLPPIEVGIRDEKLLLLYDDNISSAPTQEIVEALFLEQRKPVLIFDCNSSDSIVFKLYSAFWPGMRRNFASCTFALSSRTINGKPFDLLFSKNDLRSRFVEWPGRRIEGYQNPKRSPRHRWTSELTSRIFESETPSLFNGSDELMLHFSAMDDESRIRLRLLWEELFQKAKHDGSPFAVLGLLDIINSQKVFEGYLYSYIQPQILRAIKIARSKLPAIDAWKFYSAVLIKHRKKMMTREMLSTVRESCTHLAHAEPLQSFDFFKDNDNSGKTLPAVLYASFGDGIAGNLIVFDAIVNGFMPKTGVLLIATSELFAEYLMQIYSNTSARIYPFLENALFTADLKYRNGAKVNLAQNCYKDQHDGVVKLVLEGNSVQSFQKLLKLIGKATKFSVRRFDEIILREARTLDQEDYLLDNIIQQNNSVEASEMIVNILLYSPHLISIYFNDVRISKDLKISVAFELFSQLPTNVILSSEIDSQIRQDVVEIMLKSETSLQKALTLIFEVGYKQRQIIQLLDNLGDDQLNRVNTNVFANSVYLNIHNTSKVDIGVISGILKRFKSNNIEDFVDSLFKIMSDENQYFIKIFILLISSGEKAKDALANHIDIVTRNICKVLNSNVDSLLIDEWFKLFDRSKRHDRVQDAAWMVLEFAYKSSVNDPTELLIKVYPIVYNTFLQDRTFGNYISFIFFPDWDKCRTLRFDLVERYKNSDWSRFGLLEIGRKAGILKDIISILNDSKNGKKILEEAIDEAVALNIKRTHPSLAEISRQEKKKKGKKKK